MNKNLKKVRPRIQRAFISWFAEKYQQISVPIRIGRRTRRSIEFEFPLANSLITATLTSSVKGCRFSTILCEINIALTWQGECWDLLACFEAIPERTNTGYVCSLCDPELCWPEPRAIYQSREHLWRDHLFEPFLEWVNNKLTKALWIQVGGEMGSYTYAKLLDSLPDSQGLNGDCQPDSQIIGNPMYISDSCSLNSLTGCRMKLVAHSMILHSEMLCMGTT